MPHYPRKKRPSPYRFLKPLYYSVVAVMVAWLYRTQIGALCDMVRKTVPNYDCTAQNMPTLLAVILSVMFFGGLISAAFLYFKDKNDPFLNNPYL